MLGIKLTSATIDTEICKCWADRVLLAWKGFMQGDMDARHGSTKQTGTQSRREGGESPLPLPTRFAAPPYFINVAAQIILDHDLIRHTAPRPPRKEPPQPLKRPLDAPTVLGR